MQPDHGTFHRSRGDDDLLDDPVRLEATDVGGLLRAAATAGAQVRSTVGGWPGNVHGRWCC
jgi:hypothetical protein